MDWDEYTCNRLIQTPAATSGGATGWSRWSTDHPALSPCKAHSHRKIRVLCPQVQNIEGLSVYPSERPARPFTNSRSATPDPSYTYLSMRLPAPLRIPTVPPCAVLVCFVIRTAAAAAAASRRQAPSGERRAAAHASPQIRLSKS